MSPIVQGLIITAIGMGLVFVAILALWGLMILLVRITADRPKAVEAQEPQTADLDESASTPAVNDKQQLHLAAAAAVAVALQLAQRTNQVTPQDSSGISPWQAAHRAAMLSRSPRVKGN